MALSDRVTATVVRTVRIGWLDFETEPTYGWTGAGDLSPSGTGDTVLDSNTFLSVGSAFDMSEVREGITGNQAVTLTYSAHADTAEAMRQVIRDDRTWQLRRAKIWQAFLMSDEETIHPEIEQMFSGVMVGVSLSRSINNPATITIEIDNDLRFQGDGTTRLTDHERFNSGDTFGTYIVQLANGKLASAKPQHGPGGGGSFSAGPGHSTRNPVVSHL